jgi:hypothetical protein
MRTVTRSPPMLVDMARLRAGAVAAALARALWRLVRFVLIWIACVLGADLLVAVIIVPPMLLGPAAGLPVTAALLALGGYAARRIYLRRLGADERRRRLERAWARRRHKERQWSRTLHWLERTGPPQPLGYREAASDIGFFGYAGGVLMFYVVSVVAFEGWPRMVKSLPLPAILGALLACSLAGFGAVVLYTVHLHHRVSPRVLAWRRHRLRARLDRSAARRLAAGTSPALVGLSWDAGFDDDDAGPGGSGGGDFGGDSGGGDGGGDGGD